MGARVDRHNLIEKLVFSPRVNLRWSPSDAMGFRASYSSGYRAPQTYDEDLHVDAVGGSLALIELAENLRPEYSHSISGSADLYHHFGAVQTNLLIEGFYTLLTDVFQLNRVGESADGSLSYWHRTNGSGAKVKGINLEGKLGSPGRFELQMGFTLQRS